ncbi:hypothetical protein WJX74_011090 [Apatococcus lobatus]|uniref:Uncharacterized protein n=1 Tax=Apatococcus lobatus TaxID=904363 RepID=A0AAW1R0W0_9CHLO
MPPKRRKENLDVNLQRGTLTPAQITRYAHEHLRPESDWSAWGAKWHSMGEGLTRDINRKRRRVTGPLTEEQAGREQRRVAEWRELIDIMADMYPHDADDMYDVYKAMADGPRVNPEHRQAMVERREELRDMRERLEQDRQKLAEQRSTRKRKAARKRRKTTRKSSHARRG